MYLPAELIKKKRAGESLNQDEIAFLIRGYTQNQIPDYQMSALLMAIFFQGMSAEETLHLTHEMLHSGDTVDLSDLKRFKVDKHSTGGVGDKTSLILGPIVAAAGLAVPMISGRGLGHTGGTLDKLESIPGFNTQLSLSQFKAALHQSGICFIGQTKEICPADKKLYALRDVTATVESLPLICASILSKKLAEGIDGLVLDVKFGNGAFMKGVPKARELAQNLMRIAQGAGKKVAALLTNMDQPLGAFAGNSLEVEECLRILRGEKSIGALGKDHSDETRFLSLELSAWMMHLGGLSDLESCRKKAEQILSSGQAMEKFEELCRIHGGNLKQLPKPKNSIEIKATESGFVQTFETEKIGWFGVKIRAGRSQTTDVIEPTAGIQFHAKIGDQVKRGDPLMTVSGADASLIQSLAPSLSALIQIGPQAVTPPPLILETFTKV